MLWRYRLSSSATRLLLIMFAYSRVQQAHTEKIGRTLTLRETVHLQAGALLVFIARYLDRAMETEILSRFCCSTPHLQLPDRWAV